MATAQQLLQIYGLDFAMFTPFTEEEAQTVLGLSIAGYLQARRDGALTCSVTMHEDPLKRLRFHSLWDLIECTARIDAGWPSVRLGVIDEQVLEASAEISHSLFEEESGLAASKHATLSSFTAPAFFGQVHQKSGSPIPSDSPRILDGQGDEIVRATHRAFWKTLDRVNRLMLDTVKVSQEVNSNMQLSLQL